MSLLLGDHTLAGLKSASELENVAELAAAAAQTAATGVTDENFKGKYDTQTDMVHRAVMQIPPLGAHVEWIKNICVCVCVV